MTSNELKILQSLPLEVKIAKTKARIHDAVQRFGTDGLYISFSGGKDSTVLRHIVKELYPNIPAVFCDTGLEYPELKEFATRIADAVIRPKMTFVDVLKKYGYPLATKKVSRMLHDLQNPTVKNETSRRLYLSEKRLKNGVEIDAKNGSFKLPYKWRRFIYSDIPVSNKCCDEMKKKPFSQYTKGTGRIPMVGMMAGESEQRRMAYIQTGCNSFDGKKKQSRPIGFWTEQDILQYIKQYNIEIPSVYGEIVECQVSSCGQVSLFDTPTSKLKTTGCNRTGCVFCMYGCHLEKESDNRFIMLEQTHPKLHDYCMKGGKYDENGRWVPDKGLGMAYVLNTLGVDYTNDSCKKTA